MAKKITDDQKIQINELYKEIGVKSKVAKILGISVSSVSKYLVDGYIPAEKREKEVFKKTPTGFLETSLSEKEGRDLAINLIQLLPEEWEELKTLQKGIFI